MFSSSLFSPRSAILFFLLSLVLFVGSFQYWHSLATPTPFAAFSITEFSQQVSSRGPACVKAEWQSNSFSPPTAVELQINGISKGSLSFSSPFFHCVPLTALQSGWNQVQLLAPGGESVWFWVNKGEQEEYVVLAADSKVVTDFSFSWLILVVVLLVLGFLVFFVFQFGFLWGTGIWLWTILVVLSLLPMLFFFLGVPFSFVSIGIILLLFLTGAALVCRARLLPWKWSREDLFFVGGFVVWLIALVLIQLVLPSHWWEWNTFYERQSEAVFLSQGAVWWDSLSYLGRPLSFAPGYFWVEAGLAQLTGVSLEMAFVIVLLFSLLFFWSGSWAIGKRIGFSDARLLLLFLFSWLFMFSFNNALVSPRHVLGLGLLFWVLALLFSSVPVLVLGVLVGVMVLVQLPLLVWLLVGFGIVWLAFFRNFSWLWRCCAAVAIGLLVLGLVYGPLVWNAGIPSEASPREWGYGLAGGIVFLAGEFSLLVFVVLLLALALGWWKWKALSSTDQRLWLGVWLLLLIHLVVSFRVNILLAFFSGVFMIRMFLDCFPSWFSVNPKAVWVVLGVVLFSAFIVNVQRVSMPLFSEQDFDAFNFVQDSFDDPAVILADPLLSHAVGFFSQRKTVADLYVEFASQDQLDDAYSFLRNEDWNVLNKYAVNGVLVLNAGVVSTGLSTAMVPFVGSQQPGFSRIYHSTKYGIYYWFS